MGIGNYRGNILDPRKVYLVQTDTTVGFLSQNRKRLSEIKNRPVEKPFLISVDSFKPLKKFARVPKKFKKRVRRAKKTTFVYPNGKAVRVVRDDRHISFLKKFGWMYSTSANRSGKRFEREFAFEKADVIVEDQRGFFEGKASEILRLSQRKIKKLR
ncbi:Sua5/YciO/YrdC/YwlC family protein [Nitrosophilus alvini]|uniref:Sua5/YciO/YrdC/YwlC family protein n=1 Tax=Nitrosophilus alvini TaxID=2714855 RepID=UPI001F2A8241|nr:Sua5/YciO/YrdC/YwlC family protein [Nitrosophilus alvini]